MPALHRHRALGVRGNVGRTHACTTPSNSPQSPSAAAASSRAFERTDRLPPPAVHAQTPIFVSHIRSETHQTLPSGFPSTAPIPTFPPTPGPCCLPLATSRAGECVFHLSARLGPPCRSPSLYCPQRFPLRLAHCCTPRSRPFHPLAPPRSTFSATPRCFGTRQLASITLHRPWAWAHRLWAHPVIFETHSTGPYRQYLTQLGTTTQKTAPFSPQPHLVCTRTVDFQAFSRILARGALNNCCLRPFPSHAHLHCCPACAC